MDSLENLRVLAGSKDFFRGLQHPDSPVQIRSAPLERSRKTNVFRDSFLQKASGTTVLRERVYE